MTSGSRLESAPSAHPNRFVFGGVAFDVSAGPALPWELLGDHARFATHDDVGPTALAVHVAASSAPELAHEQGREIHVAWKGGTGHLRTRGVRAEVRELGPGNFVASALLSAADSGCTNLCTSLAGALIDRIGGVVLHASAIELDGGALLFVGPSGAGKTTIANHCAGARGFAKDRVAAYPTPSGWYAAPMAGGDEVDLPHSSERVLPLLGVLRVVQAERPSIADDSPIRAVHILRESAQLTDRSADAEGLLLDRLLEMSSKVRVGTVRSVLGDTVLDRLRTWVEKR